MPLKNYAVTGVLLLLLSGCGISGGGAGSADLSQARSKVRIETSEDQQEIAPLNFQENISFKRVYFGGLDRLFRFSAEIPTDWKVQKEPFLHAVSAQAEEFVPLYVSYYEAEDFNDAENATPFSINDYRAMAYTELPMNSQGALSPEWRNQKHEILEVKLFKTQTGPIYQIAFSPSLSPSVKSRFLNTFLLDNDPEAFKAPLSKSKERVTRQGYGLYVSPEEVEEGKEILSGYHCGTDFEIFDYENGAPVKAQAVCSGPLLKKQTMPHCGGVAMQECLLGDKTITVYYAYLHYNTIPMAEGVFISAGDPIGVLAPEDTPDSAYQQTHLHVGFRKGSETSELYFPKTEEELNEKWMDPCLYICK